MKKHIYLILTILSAGLLMGCEGFLDERPDKSKVVPLTVEDLQQLMDHDATMNVTPALGLLSSDDYYTTESGYNSYRSPSERNAYIWNSEIFDGDYPSDWYNPYQQVFVSNVVIEKGKELEQAKGMSQDLQLVMANAKFYRAHAHFNLLMMFAPQYEPSEAHQALGIPLKLKPGIFEETTRATVEEGYQQVIKDLLDAHEHLPVSVQFKSRPSKFAAYGLLSRVYLTMGDFEKVKEFSELAMGGNHQLLDYSSIDPLVAFPFPKYNAEVIFHANIVQYSFLTNTQTYADTLLLNRYGEGDLRKDLYFRPRGEGYNFRGQYTGNFQTFSGIALDEIYLNYAEALIRTGEEGLGIEILNELLETRFSAGSFTPLSASSKEEALKILAGERRKSLIFRGLNWMDLRRFNLEGNLQRILVRNLENQRFELKPNDNRYVFPIPDDEIRMNGLEQNPR